MNKPEVESVVNALQAEAWALDMAAQTADREPREAQWMIQMASRLDDIAERLQVDGGGL